MDIFESFFAEITQLKLEIDVIRMASNSDGLMGYKSYHMFAG